MLSETRKRLKAAGIKSEVKRADSNTCDVQLESCSDQYLTNLPQPLDYHRAKAVAHGGIAFYLDRNVTERTMRYTYGVSLQPGYNPSNPEHQARRDTLYTDPISGNEYIRGGFFALVKKVSAMG